MGRPRRVPVRRWTEEVIPDGEAPACAREALDMVRAGLG